MEPITTVAAVTTAINNVRNLAEPIRKIKSATAKTSVVRLTKDQVFQFPMIIDADINDDEKFPMIKSIEKNYAALVMTAIVNEGVVDRDRYDDINQFLHKFHNNGDTPFDSVVPNAMEGTLTVTDAIITEGYLSNKELMDMWDCVEEQLDSESINDMYLPYKRTSAKLTRAIENARMTYAAEADEKVYFRVPDYKKDKEGKPIKGPGGSFVNSDKNGNVAYSYKEIKNDPSDANFQKWANKYGPPKTMQEWTEFNDQASEEKEIKKENRQNAQADAKDFEKAVSTARSKSGGEMVKDEKYNALTPTILRMNIANIKKGAGSAWSQELIIGVRAMPRLLPQSIMISNMVEAFKDRAIFRFIKWTRGEIRWAHVLLGTGKAREDAAIKADRKWLKILRKRAKKANAFRAGGYKLNPNTTVIITDADAHVIQEKCGVNPRDISNVMKMMSKYFLLGFGIYDTEGKMLDIIYDGETEFTTYSMRSMIADSKKEANLLAMGKY